MMGTKYRHGGGDRVFMGDLETQFGGKNAARCGSIVERMGLVVEAPGAGGIERTLDFPYFALEVGARGEVRGDELAGGGDRGGVPVA